MIKPLPAGASPIEGAIVLIAAASDDGLDVRLRRMLAGEARVSLDQREARLVAAHGDLTKAANDIVRAGVASAGVLAQIAEESVRLRRETASVAILRSSLCALGAHLDSLDHALAEVARAA